MATPTIAMIPSGYKANKVYSVLPTNGDADLTFARTSTRTRVNSDGLVEDLATGVPALDYTDGGCPVLSLEPQSTNLITYSEDFSNAIYIKDSGVTIGATDNSDPKGGISATQINVTDSGRIYSNFTSDDYTVSVYIKAGTFAYFKLTVSEIDLVAKTNSNGTIEELSNDWFRVSVPYTGTRPFQIQAYPDNTYTAHTTSGSYYLWGAQVEALDYATSYIPTSGATATRVAETLSKTGLSSFIGQTEGVFYAEIRKDVDTFSAIRALSLNDGSNVDSIIIGFNSNSNLYVTVRVASSSDLINTTFPTVVSQSYKIALKYKSGDSAIWVNGVEVTTDTNTFTFSSTISQFNSNFGGGLFPFYGDIKDLRVFNTALTDAELLTLTT